MSFRIAGWMFPVVTIISLIIVALFPNLRSRSAEIVIPLIAAMQAALLFSPDDEPALEIMLASPRPTAWLVYERLSALLIMQLGIGVIWTFTLTMMADMPAFGDILIGWLPPTLALIGLALAITVMMRRSSFGILAAIFLYAALLFAGDMAVLRWNFAFPVHLFMGRDLPMLFALQWEISADTLYALNRAVVTLVGVFSVIAVVYRIRNTEWVLGAGSRAG
jgi:hypothetical protein